MSISIIIMDDHDIVRLGIVELARSDASLTCIADCCDLDEVHRILSNQRVDVLVTDLNIKNSNGLITLKTLLERWPEQRILVLSMMDERIYAKHAITAGARGYMMKDQVTTNFVSAVHTIANGSIWVSEKVKNEMLTRLLPHGQKDIVERVNLLSPREIEVLIKIQMAKTTKEIAYELNLSPRTIDIHRANIKKKLHVRTSAALLTFVHGQHLHL